MSRFFSKRFPVAFIANINNTDSSAIRSAATRVPSRGEDLGEDIICTAAKPQCVRRPRCETFGRNEFVEKTYSMTVYVNDKAVETAAVDIAALHRELALPDMVAIALDNAVVPRAEWAERRLSEGDKLVIIKVACGG